MPKRPLGVGIISTGWVAGTHAQTFSQIPGCEVVAVLSRKASRAQRFILDHRLTLATAHEDLRPFLRHKGLDIVVVASPHPLHPEHTIAAARAGKHVVIEKPVALEPASLARMVRAVNKAKVKTSVCFELRWNGLFRNIQSMLQRELLGNVFYGEASYHHGIGPWYPQWQWNRKRKFAGSAVLTAGCHALDALIGFMDSRVAEVAAMSNTSPRNPLRYDYDPNSAALLRFESGALGVVQTSIECRMPYTFPIRLQGDRGSIRDDQVSLLDWPATRGWARIPAALPDSGDVHDQPSLGQFEHFVGCIRQGRRPSNDLRNTAHVHEVCFAIERALRERRTVKVRRTPGT